MSVAQELLRENLPVATGLNSINPAYFVGVAGLATATFTVKKMTPHWHQTINVGEIGVPLHRGKPVERVVLDKWPEDKVLRVDRYKRYPNGRGYVTKEELEAGVSHYRILDPDWYIVPVFRTIEPVYVTDQVSDVKIKRETRDHNSDLVQLEVNAKATWNIDPYGDHPIHAITRVKHEKRTKKDTEDKDKTEMYKGTELENRIIAICASGLRVALGRRRAETLYDLRDAEAKKIQDAVIKRTSEKLIKYGIVLSQLEFAEIVRVGEEVLGQKFVAAQNPAPVAAVVQRRIPADEHGRGEVIPIHGDIDPAA